MKRILGLDASTTTIGIAVIDYDENSKNLVHYEFFHPPKEGNIFERLAVTRQFIIDKLTEFKPDNIALEDIILFMKGKSTAQTISSLAVLNRTVGLAVLNHHGKPPELFNVMKIRHALKLDKKFPSKEEMPELVAHHLGIEFPYVLMTKGKNKGKPAEKSYDMADAMAVALTFIKIESTPPKKINIKPVKEHWKKK